jgi:hypothetical protein
MWNATWTDTLKRDLLLNYDKYTRPAQYYNATNVDLSLVLRYFDVDEVKSVMTVHGWVKMVCYIAFILAIVLFKINYFLVLDRR